MTNKKALLGGLLGAAIGLTFPGATALFAFRGFAIGFSVGQLLFPPELEDDGEKERFNVTGPTPSSPVPVIWGFRHTPGSIIYFGFKDWEKVKKKDDRYYFAPMQIAICVSDWARVKMRDSQLGKWKMRSYFEEGFPEQTCYSPTSKEWLLTDGQFDQGVNTSEIPWRHSRPFLSQGGDPILTQQAFKVDGIGGGYYRMILQEDGTYQEEYVPPKTFDQWPTLLELPPLKGIVTLSHPRWYMGEGTTAPSFNFEVWNEIDLTASSFAWAVTYPELEPNADFYSHLGMNPAHCYWQVLTDARSFLGFPEQIIDEASILYAEGLFETEGYRVNANINSQTSAHSLLELLNFHTNCVLRSTLEGKVELLPLRRLDDVSNPHVDFDQEISQAPVPGKPTIFVVRDDDVRDVDVASDTWDKLPNEFQGRFPNKAKDFEDDGHTRRNEAAHQMTGRWVRRNYHFPFFTVRGLVNKRLIELQRFYGRPKSIATLVLDHRYHRVRKHDGVLLYLEEFGFNGLYFRVSEVEYGDLGDSRVTVKCVLDAEALSAGIDDATEDDGGDGPTETRLSAIDAGGHVDYWPSNVAFVDSFSGAPLPERSPATEVYGTQLYAARRSPYPTDFCVQSALGLTTASTNDGTDDEALLPETSPCTQPLEMSFRFNLAQDVYRDDHRYSLPPSLGGSSIRLRLSSYEDHDLTVESNLADKVDDADLESNPWVAILTGSPVDQLLDPSLNPPAVSEVWRFDKLVKLETGSDEEGTLYEMQTVLRGANKEHPQGWKAGQEVWIARLYREGDLPEIPNGVEGVIGGKPDNFQFGVKEYDSWIQMYNDPYDLRNGSGGVGAPPPITGATGLTPGGHTVTDGITTFVEGTDYEVDDETGMIYFYSSGAAPSDTPLTVTLQLKLSVRWAHRHLSAAAGKSVASLGALRVRLYTQGRRIVAGEIVDAEGPLEGITRDFDRFDSNFFSPDDRRRAAISPMVGGIAFKYDSGSDSDYSLYGLGIDYNHATLINDARYTLLMWDMQWPSIFNDAAKDWRVEDSPIYDFSLGFSGEFDGTGAGRVFSFDILPNGTASTNKGFYVTIESHTYPGGARIVPVVHIKNGSGTHDLYPVGTDGQNPNQWISGWNIVTKNIVITFYKDGNVFSCDYYKSGTWMGKASTSAGQLESTGGRMDIARSAAAPLAAQGHYWDVWLCGYRLSAAAVTLAPMTPPPGCLFFLPMRGAFGTVVSPDMGGLGNHFTKQSGTITTEFLSIGGSDFSDSGYYIQFPPHSDKNGFGDAWLNAATLPTGWVQYENDVGTDGADAPDWNDYGNKFKYNEHQTTWYRLDVYVRWTGLEQNPVQGEAYLLRSGRRHGLANPDLYDPCLEKLVEFDYPLADPNFQPWPTFVYSQSMLETDKARYEAETTFPGADWREADLIFVLYKCKGEVTIKAGLQKIQPWGVPTIIPIFGDGRLNYYGSQTQLVNASQVND